MKTLLLSGALALLASPLSFAQDSDKVFKEDTRNEYTHRFIFYAVFEGLFEDGVEDDVLAAMKGRHFYTNFIYACPICTPVYQALQVYESRPELTGYKAEKPKHFGKGLDEEMRKVMLGKDSDARRKAIRELVSIYIERRIKSQQLNADQQKQLRTELKALNDKGTEMLKFYQSGWEKRQDAVKTARKALEKAGLDDFEVTYAIQGLEEHALGRHYENWDFCPSCSGATLHSMEK